MYRFAIQVRSNVLYVHKSCRIQWCYFKETMWRDFYPFFGQKTPLGPLINWQKRIGELFDSGRHLRKIYVAIVSDYANMMLRRRWLCGHCVGKLLFLALLWTFITIFFFNSFDHYSPVILVSRGRIFEPLERPRSRMIPTTMQCK